MFNPKDDREMMVAIEDIVSFPERAQNLIHQGYERIKLFSWDKCAKETLDVYKRIA